MIIKKLKIDYVEGEKLKMYIKADKKTIQEIKKIVKLVKPSELE